MRAASAIARAVAVAALASTTGSCSHPVPAAEPAPVRAPRERARLRGDVGKAAPVVLVTIDGVRWQEVLEGSDPSRVRPPAAPRSPSDLMPTLHALAHTRGAMLGAWADVSIRASGPNFVSLPGYTEILTGRSSLGCRDNDCPQAREPTLLDDATEAGLRVAAFASWERLARAATARPGSFPVSAGKRGHYRPDRETAELALGYLEREQPDVLFLGLGDPDEHAHHGNYDGYLAALEYADAVLARLSGVLDAMGERGAATHVFVTADHGRAHDFKSHGGFAPESARVWLVGAGPRVRARGAPRSPHERRLSDVAPTIAAVLGLERPASPGVPGDVLDELFRQPSTTSL